MDRRRPTLIASALAAAAFLAGCPAPESKAGDAASARPRALLVRTVRPELARLERTLAITGEVIALRKTEIQARIGGQPILEIAVDVGSTVQADQTIARLEDVTLNEMVIDRETDLREAKARREDAALALKEIEAQFAAHEVTLAQKERIYQRAQVQAEQGAIAEETLEVSRYDHEAESAVAKRLAVQADKARTAIELAAAAHDRAEASLAKAKRELTYAVIRAPFDGIVLARLADPGQITVANQPLLRIFDPKSLVIETHVPQQSLRELAAGQVARIRSDAAPGEVYEARLALVSPVIEQDTGMVMVRLALDRPDVVQLGLFVSGDIVLEVKEQALAIPTKAIAHERERPFVYRVVDANGAAPALPPAGAAPEATGGAAPATPAFRVERVYVREGFTTNDRVEALPVESGPSLAHGDVIVLVGLDRLRDGDPVEIEPGQGSGTDDGGSGHGGD